MSSKRLLILCLAGGVLAACREATAPPAEVGAPVAAERVTALVSSNTWSAQAPLPRDRAYMGAAVNAGFLYVAGGLWNGPNGAVGTTNLQVYNLDTRTWSMRKNLPQLKSYSGAAFINGKLYVTGGFGDFGKALFVYNPATDSWTRKANMPEALAYARQGVINGQLYVYSSDLFRYNPATNAWTKLARSPGDGILSAAGVIGGRLYVAGGSEQPHLLPDHQCLCLRSCDQPVAGEGADAGGPGKPGERRDRQQALRRGRSFVRVVQPGPDPPGLRPGHRQMDDQGPDADRTHSGGGGRRERQVLRPGRGEQQLHYAGESGGVHAVGDPEAPGAA